MAKKKISIPVNMMIDDLDIGIAIEKIAFLQLPLADHLTSAEGDRQSHRHNTHTFHLLQKGTVTIDIDFQQYKMGPSSIMYIHPDQVHQTTAYDPVTVVSLAITNENLNSEYLNLLENLVPVHPLPVASDTFDLLDQAVSLCLNLADHSVSYHIQQRLILEAKRLLYHSDQSVKEIAAQLGYDDYSYFSRLFTKVTGMTALAFRAKNRD